MALLQVRKLAHAYGSGTQHPRVIRDLSFAVEAGRIACLLGPSGCGKTTVLRCLAGFEEVADGEIVLSGETVSRKGYHVPPERRRIGMVFQDYALFPHLSVADNIGFGLKGATRGEKAARVAEMLALVGLEGRGDKFPHELSGGQQQRVALARALAPRPQILLLDEPFSNLDVELRERLSIEVRDIIKEAGITAILVTHDQHEAFAMADEIGILSGGVLQQWDEPYNLYHRPANRFVADFIGQGVLVPGTVAGENQVNIELGQLKSAMPIECSRGCQACPLHHEGCRVDVLLRPDDVVHDDASPQKAEIVNKAFRGADILYTLRLASGTRLLSLVPSHHNHAVGEAIGIRLDVDHVVAFRNRPADGNSDGAAISLPPARTPVTA